MSTKQDKRRQKKAKERERCIKQARHTKEQRYFAAARENRAFESAVEEYRKEEDSLVAEVLVEAAQLPLIPENQVKMQQYLERVQEFCWTDDDLYHDVRTIFGSYPSIPNEVTTVITVHDAARSIVSKTKNFSDTAVHILESEIGKLMQTSDSLDSKIEAECQKPERREKIIAAAQKGCTPFFEDEETPQLPPDETVNCFIEHVLYKTLESQATLERAFLGTPYDFLRELAETILDLKGPCARLFITKVNADLDARLSTAKDLPIPSALLSRKDGSINFSLLSRYVPHIILPDPFEFSKLTTAIRALDKAEGGEAVVAIIRYLEGSNVGFYEAIDLVTKIPCANGRYIQLKKLLEAEPDNVETITRLAAVSPEIIDAAEILIACQYTPAQAAEFVRNYGDFPIRKTDSAIKGAVLKETPTTETISAAIVRLGRSRETLIKLIVDNALYTCLSETTPAMISLVEDLPRAARFVRHYLAFAKENNTNAQAALIEQVKKAGTADLDAFALSLTKPATQLSEFATLTNLENAPTPTNYTTTLAEHGLIPMLQDASPQVEQQLSSILALLSKT